MSPDCDEPVVETCDNGIDDTGNGLVDCADPECDGFVDGAGDTGEPGICAAGTFVCNASAAGSIDWTAIIDAPGNDDPSNDVLTGTTSVTCR